MDSDINPSTARSCWNWGGWIDLVGGFRLSASGPRIGLALLGVITSWMLLALLDRIWIAFGYDSPLAGFAGRPIAAWWEAALHSPVFVKIAAIVLIAIWALLGGAIFRGQAVVYGAQRRAMAGDMFAYGRDHWWRLVKAMLLPVIGLAIPAVFCIVNGLVLRIPWIGDILGGLMLGMSIVAGIWVAYVVVIWMLTAPLYGPTIGADGFAAAECVTRCATYVQSRLVRTLWLYAIGLAMAIAAWWVVAWLCQMGVDSARRLIGIGYGPWSGDGPANLSLVWPTGGASDGFAWVDTTLLMRHRILHLLIGGWVYLLRALICAWAVNLLFAMATIIYFNLRRDVDAVSDGDVCGLPRL